MPYGGLSYPPKILTSHAGCRHLTTDRKAYFVDTAKGRGREVFPWGDSRHLLLLSLILYEGIAEQYRARSILIHWGGGPLCRWIYLNGAVRFIGWLAEDHTAFTGCGRWASG